MMNTGPMTTVSLLLGTIICLGAFFLIDNNIPAQALHKEEQILESYDSLADFANAVKSGDEEDLEEIPIQSMEAADIYDDADDNLKDCIDLAAEVGDSLTDREVVHCVDDANYFENKYTSNNTVPADTGIATTTDAADTNEDTATDTASTSDTSTSDTSTSDTSTSDTSTSDTSTSDTSTSDTSTSDTSTSDTSTSDDVTGNSLIDELVKTGKFTEDEAKQFASQNMLNGPNTTSSSDDTQAANTDDTQAANTDDTQAANTDDTQASSSNNEQNQADTSDSNNSGNPEDYDSLSQLVNDIKNGIVDTDDIPLNDLQNSGAYQGADEQTQACIDLAAKFGNKLNDYEIVRCSEDPNHFKNMIANNNADTNDESNNANNDNNGNNNESDDGTV